MSVVCGCYDSKPCVHAVACLSYLRRQLTNVPGEQADQWIQSCVSDGREVGRRIIHDLARTFKTGRGGFRGNPFPNPMAHFRRGYRHQHFISSQTRDTSAIFRRRKSAVVWTKGRLLKNFFENVPDAAMASPVDRTLATLLQVSNDSFMSDPW